ncbi:MAG: TetR/AcrR family transcriptional regulator [Gemmatimonadales bacterium]
MELRERILEAAAAVYAETGFRGATTRRIAERAGVNEITLFRHFGSKTMLLHEAVRCAGLEPNLCPLPDRPGEPFTDLRDWARNSFEWLYERRSLIRTAMGEMDERPDLLPADRSPAVCAGQALAQYLLRLQETGVIGADVDVRAAAMMFMGTIFSDAITRDFVPAAYRPAPETSIEQYVTLFTRALGIKEQAR